MPMSFSDVPAFPFASYRTDVDLSGLEDQIERYVDKYGLDMIPWFQRGHVWTPEQRVAYVEYFLRGGLTGRDIFFNHPGWMGDYKGEMVLVDGLQRVSSLFGFIRGEVIAFGQTCEQFGDTLTSQVGLTFHINNLKTEQEWVQWYLDFNTGGTDHSPEEIARVRAVLSEITQK